MSGWGLINDTAAWKTLIGKAFLRVCAILDPSVLTDIFATQIKETIVESTANDKNTHVIVDGLKRIIIRSEKVTKINYSFDETRFDDGNVLTITSGGHLKLEGLFFSGKTLYFKTDKNADVEIIELY